MRVNAIKGPGEKLPDGIYENLPFRNQFVLGPAYVESLPSWQRLKVSGPLCLTAHPALNTLQATRGDTSITLLGYIIDPDNPDHGDEDILNRMILHLSGCDGFFEQTYKFGGRWVLIVNDGKNVRLFNDAAGLRQVFYTDMSQTGVLWCASQPRIIAGLCGLEMDPDAVDFIDSYEFRKKLEYRFPAYSSPYREIAHLLPNHYLDLKTGTRHRHWPNGPLKDMSPDDAIEEAASMLTSLLTGISRRFDLAISLTAGLDSRIVLAASRSLRDRISFMTVRQIDKPDDHPDVAVASELLSRLALKHDVVRSSLIMEPEFLRVFSNNVPVAHAIYAPDAHAILHYSKQTMAAVTGSVSEIGRCSFRSKLSKSDRALISARDLASLQGMGESRFADDHFTAWLDQLGDIYNYHILDLFEWEQGHGSWLAMCQLEFDIAWREIFTPFNCRHLLMTLLAVNDKYRKPPYELHEKLIRRLWPELLSVPVNPHSLKRNKLYALKSFARNRLRRYVPDSVKRYLRA